MCSLRFAESPSRQKVNPRREAAAAAKASAAQAAPRSPLATTLCSFKRKSTDDRRVRLVELTAKGRALITKTFREHATAMEEAAGVLSKQERLILLRLLKKLGKGGKEKS